MSELLTIGLFCAGLIVCVTMDWSILYALLFGLIVFLCYGRHRGFSADELGRMMLDGVRTVRNILTTLMIIGMMTAIWRAAGTIPAIVCYASNLIRPQIMLLMTFLLNALVSVLTGSAFGTGATMGVICAAVGTAMGVDIRLLGGAVLSGAYFGDRCSPVATSALLVADLTGTSIYDNIRRMSRTMIVPMLLTCLIYGVWGMNAAGTGEIPDLRGMFGRVFVLHPAALLPAAAILLLSGLRVNVKKAMIAGIVTALPLCVWVQGMSAGAIVRAAVFGYTAGDAEVGAMINGGGVVSMLRVAGIVCLSASYSGIFRKTGLLDGVKRAIYALEARTSPYAATMLTSAAAGMIACNQTLTIMLTHQLCAGDGRTKEELAHDLEDSAVLLSALVPWSIAGGVPLASAGAPISAMLFAFYPMLLPLCRLAGSLTGGKNRRG